MGRINNKKTISPVVATALLLVVAVISVVGFGDFFTSFQSNIQSNIETNSNNIMSNKLEIETLVGSNLYLRNNDNKNITIKNIRINGINCEITSKNIINIDNIDLSKCLENFENEKINIIIETNKGIIKKYFFLRNKIENDDKNHLSEIPTNYIGIYTSTDLDNIRNDLTGKYILMNNLDLSSIDNWKPIGNTTNIFTGILNGNNYTISNLKINRPTEDYIGLFGITDKSEISFLNLNNINIEGHNNIGAFAGQFQGTIKNSCSEGIIIGNGGIGGLLGLVYYDSDILNTCSKGTIVGNGGIGGLIFGGYKTTATIINNSYSNINVQYNNGTSSLFIGFSKYISVYNSYLSGSIISYPGKTGVFFVESIPDQYSNNFFDITVSGETEIYVDGPEYNYTNEFIGKTTSEMKTAQTFINAGWDETIWNLQDGSYPKFQWE